MAGTLVRLAGIPVTELKGVGPRSAAALEQVEVRSLLDLLMYYPRRYLDRTKEVPLGQLRPGEEAMVLARVVSVGSRVARNRRRMVTAEVTDGQAGMRVTFFNQPWRERQLTPGTEVVLFGKLELFRGRRQMTNPVVDLVGDKTGRIIPVYPQSEKAGVQSSDVARWVAELLRRTRFDDPVPDHVRARWGLVDRRRAFHDIHAPESMRDLQEARRRLVFDELLRVQLELVQRKRELEATTVGIRHDVGGELVARFHQRLPFPLTGAQRRVITEIERDLTGPHPMHRLLQGDVGAGKTVVAVSALLVAVQGGHQGALMAPTAVLAEQHHLGIRRMLEGFTVPDTAEDGNLFASAGLDRELRVELLTNRTTAAERRRLLAELERGGIDILIGTHALIQEGVSFRALGVVVIDEQHRFGVEQRAALRAKSTAEAVPDVLVMTATPIPRTAAMTVYGDLDVSVLDELPPGRTPIVTRWARGPGAEEEVWDTVRAEVAAGRQAYVVCPLVEESDKLEVASAEETFERLAGGELRGLRLGLLHGRVGPSDKEAVMGRFRDGELDVLVATTVIEVGVDVPNATVMVILDADRFGIAQLHQLRGRVGRGEAASVCYLVGDATTAEGEQRLQAMVRTTDGFELAEVDLELRGEGTIMGERQKGRNDLRLASLRRDREWVGRAREVAFELVGDDPSLAGHPALAEELAVLLPDEDAAEFLLKS
ncbi:ATP-dependent DNA helicase RecG [Rhabdothermincola sediminis]|uniref:ATP-dependent DNA helicase RecG n=1 Tax=Rhabdothermincola sediminis TaxID=2751370 RepID=UPI001AA08037|nr:ATP-dependent DNA helicase RecG [Rhabdothermincola sediminis]